MRGLVIGVTSICLSACGSTGSDAGAATSGGTPTLDLTPPGEGSEEYLRICGRYGLGQIGGIALSPDRATLAVGGSDLALIFNGADGSLLHRYAVDGSVTGISFTPDGARLVIATSTQVQLFDVSSETALAQAESPHPDDDPVYLAVAVAADSTFATIANQHVRLYSADGRTLREVLLPGLRWSVNALSFVPETSELLVNTEKGVASILPSTGEWTMLHPLEKGSRAVATAPGGLIAASDEDGHVWVWRRGETAPLLQKSVPNWMSSIAISSDGRLLAAGNNLEWHVWEIQTGVERPNCYPGFTSSNAPPLGSRLGFNAANDAVLFTDAYRVHSCRLSDATEGLGYGWGHADWFESAAVSPDQNLFASSARDQVIVWKRADESIVTRLVPPGLGLSGQVTFSADSRRVYSSAAGTVHEWDIASGTLLRSLQLDISAITTLSAAPDGKTILAGLIDHEFVTISTETFQPIAHVPAPESFAMQGVFSPDSSAFVTTVIPNQIGAWDAQSGVQLSSATIDAGLEYNQIFFAAGGTRVVAAANETVWVYAWPGLATKFRLPQGSYSIETLAPMGDDHHFLSLSGDAVLWDINQGKAVSRGTIDANGVPRIALPKGMSASLLMVRDASLRLYCNDLAKPGDPLGYVQPAPR
ncbi:MAG: WD40 repeat domain-containing protein [Pseudomonadota bacterium]